MRFLSTKNSTPPVSFSESLLMGLAPDGGLLIPEKFPDFNEIQIKSLAGASFLEVAQFISKSFVANDDLAEHMDFICAEALIFRWS